MPGAEPWSGRTPNQRALAAGLRLRPLEDTARDTLTWALTLEGDPPRQVDGRYRPRALTREKERMLLARLPSSYFSASR